MIAVCFIVGLLVYSGLAYISYEDSIKNSWYFYYLGIGIAIVANFAWLTIAKTVPENSKILIYGSIWDAMILFTFITIPFIFFEMKLTTKDWIGLSLIILGILIVKVLK